MTTDQTLGIEKNKDDFSIEEFFAARTKTWEADKWHTDALSGQALYQFADQIASDLGWVLNLSMDGHRLSDFPHTAYYPGKLAAIPFRPNRNLWVLEIQIRHPQKPFGGFYEDILM
ncbi:hypothetical protein [Iningainema tapete]|uniref:Uncharacterized protein n=1 Tax=Iningainema tapete BLCC-T55 TaxID=2748662 RepID=A0A8J6XM37_9CYAN|nr:hypothetical protein [Iningainema tapete]MBD2775346.1 hypothetical protein [Iningainema tapete BLCC-T55]